MATPTEPIEIGKLVLTEKEKDEDFIDPWNVAASSDTGVDYEKLISKKFLLARKKKFLCLFFRIKSISLFS